MLDKDISLALGSPPTLPKITPEILALTRAEMLRAGRLLPAPAIETVKDFEVGSVPLRFYRPASQEPVPLLVFLHGGGWIFGDLDTHDAIYRILANRAGCAALAVGYRLAPEHPFPAGLDDVEAAWQWMQRMAPELGCDPDRLALGGESAGANLAAALTIRLRDSGRKQPLFQLLVHPATDLHFNLPSINQIDAPGLDHDFLSQCVSMYVGDADLSDPLISPLRAVRHDGLSPAIILTAEEDPLRDDGEYYARALAASGVETLCRRLPGLPHGFLFLPVTLQAVSQAFETIADLLRRYFDVRDHCCIDTAT